MRDRFLRKEDETAARRPVHRFLLETYPNFDAIAEVTEVFILRDVIAHNHLWRLQSISDRNIWTDLVAKEMDELSARAIDAKYKEHVDASIARTNTLCLHVIPTQIDRSDLIKVLRVARTTLDFLSSQLGPSLGVQATQAQYRGSLVDLPTLLDEAIRAI